MPTCTSDSSDVNFHLDLLANPIAWFLDFLLPAQWHDLLPDYSNFTFPSQCCAHLDLVFRLYVGVHSAYSKTARPLPRALGQIRNLTIVGALTNRNLQSRAIYCDPSGARPLLRCR